MTMSSINSARFRTVRAFVAQVVLMLVLGWWLARVASPGNALWESLLMPVAWSFTCIMSYLHWEKVMHRLRGMWERHAKDDEGVQDRLDRWSSAWMILWMCALLGGAGYTLLILISYLPRYR